VNDEPKDTRAASTPNVVHVNFAAAGRARARAKRPPSGPHTPLASSLAVPPSDAPWNSAEWPWTGINVWLTRVLALLLIVGLSLLIF